MLKRTTRKRKSKMCQRKENRSHNDGFIDVQIYTLIWKSFSHYIYKYFDKYPVAKTNAVISINIHLNWTRIAYLYRCVVKQQSGLT